MTSAKLSKRFEGFGSGLVVVVGLVALWAVGAGARDDVPPTPDPFETNNVFPRMAAANPDRSDRVRRVLHQVVRKPQAERAAYLEQAARDPEMTAADRDDLAHVDFVLKMPYVTWE